LVSPEAVLDRQETVLTVTVCLIKAAEDMEVGGSNVQGTRRALEAQPNKECVVFSRFTSKVPFSENPGLK
jgi:hypothetical protein